MFLEIPIKNLPEDNICVACNSMPINVKKWGLCNNCYRKKQRADHKKNPPWMRLPYEHRLSRVIKKYGPEIEDDINLLKTNPFYTLEAVGEKYGFTREYARQLFKRVTGTPYTSKFKKKRLLLKEEKASMDCYNDPRHKAAEYQPGSLVGNGAIAEKLVLEKCEQLGYVVEIPCKQGPFDLIINGFKIDVKSANVKSSVLTKKAKNKGKKGRLYYIFHTRKNQHDIVSFYICYGAPTKVFYILPKCMVSEYGVIIPADNKTYRPSFNPKRKDYEKYREAWEILKYPPTNIVSMTQ
jgi:AraC-like DNA-binding protein